MSLTGINGWVALGLFVSYVLIDFFCVQHIILIQRRKAFLAAHVSLAISLLGLASTFEFIKQPLYMIPILAGTWVGTYLTVRYSKKDEDKETKK